MSAQPASPSTPKQSYASALQSTPAIPNMELAPAGVCTRAMARRIAMNAAAANLRAAKVPTRERTFTAASIAAAATALIASNSPQNKRSASIIQSGKITPPATKMASSLEEVAAAKSNCASVMVIGAGDDDEGEILGIRRLLEQVMKDNDEKARKIEELQRELMKVRGKEKVDDVEPTEVVGASNTGGIIPNETVKSDSVLYDEKQLQLMIANAVKSQLGGDSLSGSRYTKPYTKRIDNLRMPLGYQPPKFQQFDGKGNPKQHIAHFVETCNNAGTEGDLLVKQFVRSLKNIAFDWYTDLDAESIDSWDQMEEEFLNRFYCTRRIVSMNELTRTRQWEDEPVVDYISRWRALSLQCKDRISETSAVEMCIEGMGFELLYSLKGNKPRNFQELATRAHDMEITLKGHGKSRAFYSKPPTDKKEFKKTDKVMPKSTSKEAMSVSTTSAPVRISGKPNQGKSKEVAKDSKRDRLTLKELRAKKYPFPDSDLPAMLDALLENKIITLPESKRPDEANRVNDPKYCRYHRLVSHSIEDCITLKELIMRLAKEGKIQLDTDEAVQANHASVTTCHDSTSKLEEWRICEVQFGSLEPVRVYVKKSFMSPETSKHACNVAGTKNADDDEGWTVVTRRRPKKQPKPQPHPIYRKKKHHAKQTPRQIKKNKSKKVVKLQAPPTKLFQQGLSIPVTLGDFFPKEYFNKVSVNTVCAATSEEDKGKREVVREDEALTTTTVPEHSSKLEEAVEGSKGPTHMEMKQISHPLEEIQQQEVLIPNNQKSEEKSMDGITETTNSTKCVSCHTALTFSDEDLLLGSKPHNRPLYVTGYVRGKKVSRILIDGGSGVNLMPKATMQELGITMDELSDSRMMIHGFNLNGERAIGMIRVNLTIGDLTSNTLFHVMESKSSFKLLLGRPWQHENGVVASTLHQCIKYYREGERKINGDTKPFTGVESYFADARFFEEDGVSSELLPAAISSTGKRDKGKKIAEPSALASQSQSNEVDQRSQKAQTDQPESSNKGSHSSSIKKQDLKTSSNPPLLRYIPKSRRKQGESPFAKSEQGKEVGVTVKQEWVAKVIVPLHNTTQTQVMKPPPAGFVFASGKLVNWKPSLKGRFDSNAYKLMEKSGYDFKNPVPLGDMVKPHPYGLGQLQGGIPKHTGLGYELPAPVNISPRHKEKTSSALHISAEEIKEGGEEVSGATHASSAFDRISPPAIKLRSTVFDRISLPLKQQSHPSRKRVSVFTRLGVHEEKRSIFKRLGAPGSSILHHLKVPLKSKCKQGEDDTEQEVATSYHITVEEISDGVEEVEAEQAPDTLEDGGQSTVDDLKELNLGTTEDPRPIFVSTLLTREEEDVYFKLLAEYKDVFAWSYTEMPGLSPRIAVHRLAVKKGVSPKKQAQRRFRPELVPEIEKEVNKLIDAGFIREVKYPTWIANIVPVRKKNGQLRVCVDFRDLNDACPKDDFPLPVTELMIDATTGHEVLSFMDCTAGYNQIHMAPEDEEATAFRTPKGIFCYKVMPFGLKNAGATYQHAMQKIFDDMMHK